MNSDFQHQQYQHHFHHQKQQVNSLTRFCSAPSSYFATFLDAADTITIPGDAHGGHRVDFYNPEPLSPETEDIFARFMSSMGEAKNSMMQSELMVRVKQESDTLHKQQQTPSKQLGNYNTTSNKMYPSASKPPLASQHIAEGNSTPHMKIGIGGNSSCTLTRHNSTPAGFFSDLVIDGIGGPEPFPEHFRGYLTFRVDTVSPGGHMESRRTRHRLETIMGSREEEKRLNKI